MQEGTLFPGACSFTIDQVLDPVSVPERADQTWFILPS
jgi:hypothetical protein